jgi:inosine-uridine nucleoside N-ribohydrolase
VVADIYAHFAERYFEVTGMPDGPMHDPCAVLALTHPALFERQALHCEVELAGGTRGMLVADMRFPKLSATPNAEVLRRIDAQAARRVLEEALLGAVGA